MLCRFIHVVLSFSFVSSLAFGQQAGQIAGSSASAAFKGYLSTFEQIPSPTFGRVNCILRDRRGFLWFGTTRGLCRYDGYEARVFSNGPSLDMRQQVITAMMELDEKSFLLGTPKGLWTFDLETEQFTRFLTGQAFSDTGISALAKTAGKKIWIGTIKLGLYSYNPVSTVVERYTKDKELSDKEISSLLSDHSGMLWIGTIAGLYALDPLTSRIVHAYREAPNKGSLMSDHISALFESSDGEVWIGTDEGLHVLQPKTDRMRRLEIPSSTQHTVWAITDDPSGRIWIAASEFGLLAYENGKLTQFTTLQDVGRSLTGVRVLYVDPLATSRENLLLWVGTRTGVNKVFLSQNPFTCHIRNQNLQLSRGGILSIWEDRSGILWIGLWGGGLNGFRKTHGVYRRVFSLENTKLTPDLLPNNDVGIVLEDRDGNLWLGTTTGIAVFNSRREHIATYKHVDGDSTSLVSDYVSAIYEDRSGTIWISTRGGLSELKHGGGHGFKNYLCDSSDAIPQGANILSDILEDHQSNIWLGTFGRGLIKKEPNGTFSRFIHPGGTTGMSENMIYTFIESRDGNFWLSTGGGLVSFNPQSGKFIRYRLDQLNSAYIFGIFEDRQGTLWLSTGIGLVKFSPKTGTFVRFDEKNGIPFKEFRCPFHRNARGKLFAGGLDGFVEFEPDSVSPESTPPEITLTSFSVFDKELFSAVRTPKEIRLSHDQNFFSFSFAALDYVNPRENRFAYKMEGVDRDWIQAGTRNYASYTHLDPGEYLFRVKGSNSTNVWNEVGTSIAILITPPYWETWWFRILAAIIVVGTIYAAYRYRVVRALEVERMRLRIAADLHDDVGSNLSTIAMVSRVVQRSPELSKASRNKLSEIYDTAISTSEGMKDIVWFIKPEGDTLDDLLLRMKDTASSLLAEIVHDFHAPGNGSSMRVTIDFKRNFFLAFKEILTNIVKHASSTKVQIRVQQQNGVLELVVQDNGRGFDHGSAIAARRGNGLDSLQSRARNIGGVCEISSAVGKGTMVRFSGRL